MSAATTPRVYNARVRISIAHTADEGLSNAEVLELADFLSKSADRDELAGFHAHATLSRALASFYRDPHRHTPNFAPLPQEPRR